MSTLTDGETHFTDEYTDMLLLRAGGKVTKKQSTPASDPNANDLMSSLTKTLGTTVT